MQKGWRFDGNYMKALTALDGEERQLDLQAFTDRGEALVVVVGSSAPVQLRRARPEGITAQVGGGVRVLTRPHDRSGSAWIVTDHWVVKDPSSGVPVWYSIPVDRRKLDASAAEITELFNVQRLLTDE